MSCFLLWIIDCPWILTFSYEVQKLKSFEAVSECYQLPFTLICIRHPHISNKANCVFATRRGNSQNVKLKKMKANFKVIPTGTPCVPFNQFSGSEIIKKVQKPESGSSNRILEICQSRSFSWTRDDIKYSSFSFFFRTQNKLKASLFYDY